jgi:hypothetical protein
MRFLVVAVAAIPLCLHTLPAQTAAPTSPASRATALLGQAEALTRTDDLPERARLFEDAAGLMSRTDPRASLALRSAAETYRRLHQSRRAMQLLEKAGELAAWRGDPTEAADDYVAALFIALELNSRSDARRFIDRAIALTTSPAMPEGDRQRILRRISQPALEFDAAQPSMGRSPR